jgi:hypothetical protein
MGTVLGEYEVWNGKFRKNVNYSVLKPQAH